MLLLFLFAFKHGSFLENISSFAFLPFSGALEVKKKKPAGAAYSSFLSELMLS